MLRTCLWTILPFVVILCNSPPLIAGPAPLPTDGLIAHYRFEETPYDSAGSYDCNEFGGVAYSDGIDGKALSLDGVDDYLRCLPLDTSSISASMSISLWVNRLPISADKDYLGVLVSQATENSWSPFSLYFSATNSSSGTTDSFSWYLSTDGSDNGLAWGQSGNDFGNRNSWYHVVAIYDGANNEAKLYIDGQEVAVTWGGIPIPSAINPEGGDLVIGNWFTNHPAANPDAYPFGGKIDDLRIYNRVLSEDEVQRLHGVSLSFEIANVAGGAEGLEGIWLLEVFDTNEQKIQQHMSDKAAIPLNLAEGSYTAKVRFLFDDGMGIWEYWGDQDFTVISENQVVSFTRDMAWLGNISPWNPSVEQDSQLAVTCTINNDLSQPLPVILDGQIGDGVVVSSSPITIPGNSSADITFQIEEMPTFGIWPIRYWVKADPEGDSTFTITDHAEIDGYLTIPRDTNYQSDAIYMDYRDENGDLWQLGVDFNNTANEDYFYAPQDTFKNLKFYKNGRQATPTDNQRQLLLDRVARQFDAFFPNINVDAEFEQRYGIWEPDCGWSWACNLALVDFDDHERKVIYKDMIWEAITARQHYYLNAEYLVPDQDAQYVSSALPLQTSAFIDDLWGRLKGAIGVEVKKMDRMKKIFLFAKETENDPALLGEIETESKQLGKAIKMLKASQVIGEIALHTVQNMMVMDFLATTSFAAERLATFRTAYDYVGDNLEARIDPVLLEAINEVESELDARMEELGNSLQVSILDAALGDLDDPNVVKQKLISLADGSKLAKKVVGSIAKNLKLSKSGLTEIVGDVFAVVHEVIRVGDDWRRIILSGTLSKTVFLYAQESNTWKAMAYPEGGVVTWESLKEHQVRDVFDLQSVFAYEHLNGGMELIEPDWSAVVLDAQDSMLSQTTSPPYERPLHFASTAGLFGKNLGLQVSQIAFSDSVQAAYDMLESIVTAAERKNKAMNEWAIMIANAAPASPGIYPAIHLLLLNK